MTNLICFVRKYSKEMEKLIIYKFQSMSTGPDRYQFHFILYRMTNFHNSQ